MCYVVETETILLNYFAESEEPYLSFYKLDQLISEIKKETGYSVIVDTDREALWRVASMHNNLFKLKPTYIELASPDCRAVKAEIHSLKEAYNSVLPDNVKATCDKIFSPMNKNSLILD